MYLYNISLKYYLITSLFNSKVCTKSCLMSMKLFNGFRFDKLRIKADGRWMMPHFNVYV